MDLISILVIAIGLAMDCFAVSVTKGLEEGRWNNRVFVMAVFFGLFQGAMPLIGYYAGTLFASFFSRFAPWIALVLLTFIGGRMLLESRHHGDEDSCSIRQNKGADMRLITMLELAVATSIDALATGVIFIPCPEILWLGVGIIALISFVFSMAGYIIGWQLGCRFRLNVECVGGIILIAIGIKIFLEGIL